MSWSHSKCKPYQHVVMSLEKKLVEKGGKSTAISVKKEEPLKKSRGSSQCDGPFTEGRGYHVLN